jgi:hypothetical protein
MRSDATGQVITYMTTRGRVFALRFRARGRRRMQRLGGEWEGWTAERAGKALVELMVDVRAGRWHESRPALDDAIRTELAEGDHDDPHDIASRLLGRLDEEVVYAELEALIADRVRDVIRRQRRQGHTKDAGLREEDPADWRVFSPVADEWVRLGKCTLEQVCELRDDRVQRGAAMLTEAQRFEQIILAMIDAGAAVVEELPVQTRIAAANTPHTIITGKALRKAGVAPGTQTLLAERRRGAAA